MKHRIGSPLAVGLMIGAGIIILVSTSASAGNDKIANQSDPSRGEHGVIVWDKVQPGGTENAEDDDLPLADEAAEEAMSNQNAGSGTVSVPSEDGSGNEDSGEQSSR
jgi:hypothetical protein